MNCNNYFDMTDQGDSFETWQGLRGPAGPQGPAGTPGAPGTSVELRGPVATVGDLPATASSSELWLVGSAAPYHGWFYNGEAWEDAGEIAVGPTGPQGPAGQDGTDGSNGVTFTPTVSSAGVISWTNDGGLPNPDSVNIKGPAGQDGTNGQDGAPGAAAGFGVPTASVDGNVGTPSVTVTASGPDTAKVFAFAFSNLKGEPGSGSSIDPYTSNPADLAAAASPGSASQYSRGDHVHKLPTAAQIGAYVKPSGGIPASDLAAGVIPSVPSAYTSNPEMDGTASPGSSGSWARGDHVHQSDTGKQDKITASGILKGNGSGGVSAATKGTDFGGLAFTVTLTAAGWSNNAQTVSNANFLASGYGYIVTPASASFADYASAVIYADNVTTDGSMTFHCSTAPSSDLTVNILRVVSA
ncbi:MAG: hypothetical protein II010_05000 [Oscillospiraceae bacterium]|nr:hypothetical protein [Oscillospiraceae bacterium]MBQ1805246.1 hypothetical protein [Oscillospiraceae bacterium]